LSNLRKIELPLRAIETLFGVNDANLKYLESILAVQIHARGNDLAVDGDPQDVATVEHILQEFAELFDEGNTFNDKELRDAFKQIAEDRTYSFRDHFTKSRFNPSGKKAVAAKTAMQRKYIEAIQDHDLTFGIGPAGTGKSFLGVAMAVQALFNKQVDRIILTRPAVEAGEKLGFLPGDLQDKVDPYLRPLYDALFDLVDAEKVTKMLEKRIIEVAPLAFMRGRAQTLESLLMTPDGWRRMGEIKVGDQVIGSDGKPTEVTGVYPQGKKPVYRITMTDGSSTVACAEHLWSVKTASDKRRNKGWRILQTQEMMDNLRCFHQYRYELPILSEPVRWDYRQVPLDPYTLGLLLGDGCITGKTSPSFCTNDPELVSSLELALAGMKVSLKPKGIRDYVISKSPAVKSGGGARNLLNRALRELNLLGTNSSTKFIPESYL
jgi:phosphate starvation-inducible PhoH-like protein